MKLRLSRIELNEAYTIGKLEVLSWGKWEYICDTIEDCVRDINKNGIFDGDEKKIPSETAIPYGTYEITMKVKSPKFSNFNKYPYYEQYDGKLPRLLNVNSFDGILIHVGNSAKSSSGCIIVGENTEKGKVTNSITNFCKLMNFYLLPAEERGEDISIEII